MNFRDNFQCCLKLFYCFFNIIWIIITLGKGESRHELFCSFHIGSFYSSNYLGPYYSGIGEGSYVVI